MYYYFYSSARAFIPKETSVLSCLCALHIENKIVQLCLRHAIYHTHTHPLAAAGAPAPAEEEENAAPTSAGAGAVGMLFANPDPMPKKNGGGLPRGEDA